ncbi:hypothetical protein ABZ807_19365 [Micromonospora sp. NPDC047548]|uniref:hypothetical protein n=1 Tax=Micromonospora sp. NPDC047548 TaxID=3155624 RepID=UPI0033DFA4E5
MTGLDPGQLGRLHLILLRTAGHGRDELIAAARLSLGEGDLTAAAAKIVATGLALPAEDAQLVSALAPNSVEPIGSGGAQRAYEFVPLLPDLDDVVPVGSPPVLDLTVPHPWLARPAVDEADNAAIAAAAQTAGAVALWRAWRLGTDEDVVRVYLLETDRPVDQLPGVTAVLQRALAQAEVAAPQVEVYGPDVELRPYQRHARSGSALLWTATPGRPLQIARVFDRVHPQHGPVFDTRHPHLDDPAVLAYLDAGAAVLATTERMNDVVNPAKGKVVPMTYRTDGAWIWTDTVSYYLREHSLAPDPELVAHVGAAGARPTQVPAVALYRALAALFAPAPAAT